MSQQRDISSVVVLLSGGVDSTALVNYYLLKGCNVYGIHFQYGQASSDREYQAFSNVSNYYGIGKRVINLGFSLNRRNGEFFGRNALFILGASGSLPERFSKIAIGVHSGTPYYDCTKTFVGNCQSILNGYFGGTVIIEAPFVSYTKRQVYEYCIENKIPFELTYSCENSNVEPCGICPSCKDRRMLDELRILQTEED